MGSNTKAVAAMMVVNLAMFAFVSADETITLCPTLDICVGLPLMNVTFGFQAGTPCCTLISGLLSGNAQGCICTGVVGSLFTTTLAPLLGLPFLGGLLGTLTAENYNKEISVLINACNAPTLVCRY